MSILEISYIGEVGSEIGVIKISALKVGVIMEAAIIEVAVILDLRSQKISIAGELAAG